MKTYYRFKRGVGILGIVGLETGERFRKSVSFRFSCEPTAFMLRS